MTTTTPRDYTAIAAHQPAAGLHLVISLNQDMLAQYADGEIELTDDEYADATAVLAAARQELANREQLHATARKINADRTTWLAGTGERVLGRLLANGAPELAARYRMDGITRRAILAELYQRALWEDAARPHLLSRKAAVRYLAGLIRQYKMDGEEVSDMGHDEYNGMTRADRSAYPEVYVFLLAACDQFGDDGYELLGDATNVLGW